MFDLENLNPGTRFYWPESEDEWVELRVCSDDDRRKILKEAGIRQKEKYTRNDKTNRMERVAYVEDDPEKWEDFNSRVLTYCITSWNLHTPAGDSIECTNENKLRLMNGSPKFSAWVGECLETLNEDIKSVRKSEEKN